ncbi:MAG: LPS export ABC transporter periplasmic protein LptC [bacterium]|nr:LPS export ABC transporter periplasmic protein LptC [bacterium]MCP5043142.1 LPS export ABC transporter periplasmic protein LptC [bacterium]
MTFVASREGDDALILHAIRARFDTDAKMAYLSDVDAEVPPRAEQRGFKMWCDSGVVDLSSNDFEATGNVHGEADSGERFVAEWVRYDHARGVLYTDAPVRITDRGTTVQGGGFDYDIEERSFQLRGGAKVVQDVDTLKEDQK